MIQNIQSTKDMISFIIETYHIPLKEILPEISTMLTRMIEVHGKEHPELELLKKCFIAFRTDMEKHLRKEEDILFPMILQLENAYTKNAERPKFHCGSIENPIHQMEYEHEQFDDLFKQMKHITHNFILPDDACKLFIKCYGTFLKMIEDTEIHATYENTILFARVKELTHLL